MRLPAVQRKFQGKASQLKVSYRGGQGDEARLTRFLA
jgi:hypothetical protein